MLIEGKNVEQMNPLPMYVEAEAPRSYFPEITHLESIRAGTLSGKE